MSKLHFFSILLNMAAAQYLEMLKNNISGTGNIDPTGIDYCKLKCPHYKIGNKGPYIASEDENTSCHCDLNYWRRVAQEPEDLHEFRKTVLDAHNELRNQLASGYEEAVKDLPSAANMMALSYDLELEHGARCYIKTLVSGHDVCRRTTRFLYVGQNVATGTNTREVVRDRIRAWYLEELRYQTRYMVSNLTLPPGIDNPNLVFHFTQFNYATARYVGCATGFRQNNSNLFFRWVVICNYAGPTAQGLPNKPYYIIGKPCSQCPKGTKCNKQYPNLCGEIEPIPGAPGDPVLGFGSDGPGASESASHKLTPSGFLPVAAVLILHKIRKL